MVGGEAADDVGRGERELGTELARSVNGVPEELPERVQALRAQLKESERRLKELSEQLRGARVKGADGVAVKQGKVPFVTETVDASSPAELAAYADRYMDVMKSRVVTVVPAAIFVIKRPQDSIA